MIVEDDVRLLCKRFLTITMKMVCVFFLHYFFYGMSFKNYNSACKIKFFTLAVTEVFSLIIHYTVMTDVPS